MTPRRIVLAVAGVLVLVGIVWGTVAAGEVAVQVLLSIVVVVSGFALYLYLIGVVIANRWDWWKHDFH